MAAWSRPVLIRFSPKNPGLRISAAALGLEDQLIGSNDSDRKTYILVKGTADAHARWADVHGSDQTCAGAFVPAFFSGHKAPHGSRMALFAAPVEWRRKRRRAGRAPLRRGDGRSPGRSAALRRLWRRSGATQRARRAAAFRRDGSRSTAAWAAGCWRRARTRNHAANQLRRFSLRSKNGMQQLVDALVASLPAGSVAREHSGAGRPDGRIEGWVVSAGYASDQFDAVIVATPATAGRASARDNQRRACRGTQEPFHTVRR